jgi:hypothetical protein
MIAPPVPFNESPTLRAYVQLDLAVLNNERAETISY